MARASTPPQRLADSALRILAKKPWREMSLAEVARAAKVPLADLPEIAAGKPALIGLILRRFGDAVATQYAPDRKTRPAHERLFDVGMTWFDCLARHKPAIRSLYDGLKRDPFTLFDVRGTIVGSAQWLMTLAQADQGPALSLRAAAFAAILGRAIPVWLDDDSDSNKTMARLDGDLARAESLLGKL